jgi:hypothetical protein
LGGAELPNKSYVASSWEPSLEAVEEDCDIPGLERELAADDSLKLFQGSLGIAGPDKPNEGVAEALPKYELPWLAVVAPTVLVANFGVPRGEFWKAQTSAPDSVNGVPMGERVLKSGSLTDNEGVFGLNSAAERLGRNSEALALRIRGEPKGDEGFDDPGPPLPWLYVL